MTFFMKTLHSVYFLPIKYYGGGINIEKMCSNTTTLRFLCFPEYFIATTYHMCIIHSSYLISGFGAGNIFLNILLMPVNYTLSSQQSYFKSIQCFIMAMPPNI